MDSQNSAEKCISAAHRKLSNHRERLFPPTWAAALTRLKELEPKSPQFQVTPADLLYERLIPTPHSPHGNDPEEDFRIWFNYRQEFGKLLCLYDAYSHVCTRILLAEPSEPNFGSTFEIASRIMKATGDHEISMICLDVAAKK